MREDIARWHSFSFQFCCRGTKFTCKKKRKHLKKLKAKYDLILIQDSSSPSRDSSPQRRGDESPRTGLVTSSPGRDDMAPFDDETDALLGNDINEEEEGEGEELFGDNMEE